MSRSWGILRNINEMIRFGDAKAGAILAFAGASAAFLSGKTDLVREVVVSHRADAMGWILYAAFMGYGITLVLTIVFAFKSILPSLDAGNKRSFLYFKHICEDYQHDYTRYAKALASLSEGGFEEELTHQICVNSGIATKKFDSIGRAMRCLAWVGAFWVATVFMLFILGSAS